MKKIFFSVIFCLMLSAQAYGQSAQTVHVIEAGTLSNLLSNPTEIIQLTVTGTIDARDIYYLDKLWYLEKLDLSDANIVAFDGMAVPSNPYTNRFYPANELPSGSFSLPLSSLVLPKTLTSIDFMGINQDMMPLTSLVIPEGVVTIGDYFAVYQPLFITLTLPSTLISLGEWSFFSSNNLSVIINRNPNPIDIDESVFFEVNKNTCILYVPANSKSDYESVNVWKDFANIIELPNISEEDFIFTPSDNSALIEWQPIENAEGYRIIIYSNEARTDIVCVLEFNAAGELVLVPHGARSAMQTASRDVARNVFTHTVENLQSGTPYYYTLEILGVGNVVLASLSDMFSTDEISGIVKTLRATSLPEVKGYYSITGAKLPKEPASGIYIILYDNGKAEKVVK